MLDMARAARVTEDCIRVTSDLFPPQDFPIGGEDTLISLNIDNTRVELLKKNIAGNPKFGLPSLVPKRKIDVLLLGGLDENSQVFEVFNLVRNNSVLA